MSTSPPPLPPFGVIAAALRRTTEHLAREVAMPGTARPDWNEFEWDVARAVAVMQGITTLLANTLRWRGPDDWQAFLTSQRQLSGERDAHTEALLTKIDAALQSARVSAIALKGSALRRLQLYRPGERPMGDIDLLSRPEDGEAISRALQSLDYRRAFENQRHRVFEPGTSCATTEFGEHPGNPLKIELHELVAEPLPMRPVDITAALRGNSLRPGLNPYPHTRELMRHLLLHAAGNIRAHALRQVQLHDVMLLAGRLHQADWQELLHTPDSLGGSWWMWPVLELADRYYPGRLAFSIGDFRERSPWLLRAATPRATLTEVSWSNLRIAAFPGMCWSRSAREALSFARSRVLPRRQALDDLAQACKAYPAAGQVRWYGEHHVARIMRWVFSRPPRVQTVVSLQAAMANQHGRR